MVTRLALTLLALAYTCRASNYVDLLSNLQQYLYNIDQYEKTLPRDDSQYFPEDLYGDKMDDDMGVAYPEGMSRPSQKQARDYGEAALRDQEYMKQLPISGYQFISGGTGRQEDPSEVKTDKVLPAYCTPPNPCPHGYTGGDNCLKDFDNTPDNNRKILQQQDCPCDAEHMLNCPPGKKTIDPKSGFVNSGEMEDNLSFDNINLSGNPYLSSSQKRQKIVVKKSPHFINKRDDHERFEMFPFMAETPDDESVMDAMNPFLEGQPKRTAAKKDDHLNNVNDDRW